MRVAAFLLRVSFSLTKNFHLSIHRLSSFWYLVRPPVFANPFSLVFRQVALSVETRQVEFSTLCFG